LRGIDFVQFFPSAVALQPRIFDKIRFVDYDSRFLHNLSRALFSSWIQEEGARGTRPVQEGQGSPPPYAKPLS